jgi:hypothetical protein
MSQFLNAIKADLLDRRLRPVVALLAVGLIAAVAYAALGGGSTPATPPAGSAQVPTSLPGIAVSAVQANPDQAVAETTSGSPKQRGGVARNPFTPLPGASTTPASSASTGAGAAKSTKTSSPSSSSKSVSPSSPSGSEAPTAKAPTQTTKKRVVIHYNTTAEFGVVPPPPVPGAPAPAPQLRLFKDMRLNEPLPSKQNSQLIYLGVVLRTGKDAVFGLSGEVILHGNAKCLPSPAHCQAIVLRPGQSETLESVEANGAPVTYELKLISISRSEASAAAARAHASLRPRAKVSRALLRRLGQQISLAGGATSDHSR